MYSESAGIDVKTCKIILLIIIVSYLSIGSKYILVLNRAYFEMNKFRVIFQLYLRKGILHDY